MSFKNRSEKSTYLLLVQVAHMYFIYLKREKNVILVSSMHFNDAVKLYLQKPDIIDLLQANKARSGHCGPNDWYM